MKHLQTPMQALAQFKGLTAVNLKHCFIWFHCWNTENYSNVLNVLQQPKTRFKKTIQPAQKITSSQVRWEWSKKASTRPRSHLYSSGEGGGLDALLFARNTIITMASFDAARPRASKRVIFKRGSWLMAWNTYSVSIKGARRWDGCTCWQPLPLANTR